MIDLDQAKKSAIQLIADQADDIARFAVQAILLYIKDRRQAVAVIKRAHAEYDQRFDEIEARMRAAPKTPEGQG